MQALRITLCQRRLANGLAERPELTRELRAQGHEVLETEDAGLDLDACDLVWIQGNANWYPRVCGQLGAAARRPAALIWHTEPLPPPAASGLPRPRLQLREIAKIVLRDRRATDIYTNASRLRQLARRGLPDCLVVSGRSRQQFLAEHGIAAHWVPPGYSPDHGRDLGLERDIDVLFLGTLDVKRRRHALARLAEAGLEITVEGSWYDSRAWGENRTRLLNRATILLNVPRYPGELAGLRLILGLANRCLVVTEPIYDASPFLTDEHFVTAALPQMPQVIRHYLDHPDERRTIVDAGYRFVTQELTMPRAVTSVLELARPAIERRRAAPVEAASR
jgi:hypothetical protein